MNRSKVKKLINCFKENRNNQNKTNIIMAKFFGPHAKFDEITKLPETYQQLFIPKRQLPKGEIDGETSKIQVGETMYIVFYNSKANDFCDDIGYQVMEIEGQELYGNGTIKMVVEFFDDILRPTLFGKSFSEIHKL
jgi:hypothetical protein